MKAPVSFIGFQQQQNLCNKKTVPLLAPSGPAWTHLSYAFIVKSLLTMLLAYEPFQKEIDKKDGASTNWLRESLRKQTFGINKSFSQDILSRKWLCICIRGEINTL